jgi:hypothetical protein
MVTIELTDEEAEFFIALRRAGFFELKDEFDIVVHKKNGVITDIKKFGKKPKEIFEFIYQRKKTLDTFT